MQQLCVQQTLQQARAKVHQLAHDEQHTPQLLLSLGFQCPLEQIAPRHRQAAVGIYRAICNVYAKIITRYCSACLCSPSFCSNRQTI